MQLPGLSAGLKAIASEGGKVSAKVKVKIAIKKGNEKGLKKVGRKKDRLNPIG